MNDNNDDFPTSKMLEQHAQDLGKNHHLQDVYDFVTLPLKWLVNSADKKYNYSWHHYRQSDVVYNNLMKSGFLTHTPVKMDDQDNIITECDILKDWVHAYKMAATKGQINTDDYVQYAEKFYAGKPICTLLVKPVPKSK